jgi:PAS domain S-box-containing protein
LLFSFLAFYIPLATAGSLIIYGLVKKTIQANIESELNNATASILHLVRTSAAVSIKNRLRAISEKNREIAASIYAEYRQGNISKTKAVERIRDIFLSQTIGKTGYIYCIDSAGTAVVHPRQQVQGFNFARHGFIQEQIRKKEGYIEYDWQNPGETRKRAKALYMTYFEPLDWIISVSTYREEFNELIDVEDFQKSILALRTGKTGYSYVVDGKGRAIIHPKLRNVNVLQDPGLPNEFLQEMLARKNGKIVYFWKNPDEDRTREKLVIFNTIPEYQWTVASSSYIDEIFQPLYRVRNIILLALLGALVVASAVTFWISSTLSRPLKQLMASFASGADGDFSIRMQQLADDEIGQLAAYFNTFMDRLEAYSTDLNAQIKERRQAEAALKQSETNYRNLYEKSRRSEELYRSLLNSSPDAIAIYDLQGYTQYISPMFSNIFGWRIEELEGRRIPFVPDSEVEASMRVIRSLLENGTPCQGFETQRLTRDGRLLDVSISASRYNDHQGRPAGMLVILRNISERKQLEAQIYHSQRMEAIGTLAGGIAHDFNNLLMGIQGRTSLMLLECDPLLPHCEHLKGIEEYVQRATDLTRQLLGFARGGKYEVKPTNINQIVHHSSEMFGRTQKEILVHTEYQQDIWAVEVDRSQIEQVLLNLYVNAWQAMPEGGSLYLKTENIVLNDHFVHAYGVETGPYVKISVRDTGHGMDETVRRRVFDPFFTTKEMGRGTGLGLASAYGIVRNHGGIITVDSRKGHGATFSIYLQASEKPFAQDGRPTQSILEGEGTVLLVDDEELVLDVGRQMLEGLGYTVLTAEGGQEAIDVYAHFHEQIDLVVLDMVMPDLSGGDTFNRLKEIDPAVVVLLSSGYSIDGQAQEILNRGCNGFIQKPFTLKRLSRKLQETLRSVN